MANLKEIRSRISSVVSTMQITSAMKMVSAAKLKRAQDAIIQMRPYANKLTELLKNLSASLDSSDGGIYSLEREVKKALLVTITSNRGLCGGFNAYIIKLKKNMTPIIIGGDFNVIPNDEDVYSPENFKNDACAHPLTREQFRILLNCGFTDTVKFFIDGNTNWTFWGYRGGGWQKGNGLRIDHFLTTADITDLIKKVEVNREPRGWEKASDHTPVILELFN